jgi:hypothetical protein
MWRAGMWPLHEEPLASQPPPAGASRLAARVGR